MCNRRRGRAFDSAARGDQSSTARHVRRLVGSNAMGARNDNTGPASPVRCIGGKTVACFQLRSPDRVPLLGSSGRATSGHRAGTSRSSRSGSSPGYSDLSDDKEGVEPSASGRRDRKLEQFTVHTRGPAMGTSDDSDDDDARDATMFAKGDGRAPWEAASFFGWSNRLRGKNKKGRSRDRHVPRPSALRAVAEQADAAVVVGLVERVCALVVAAGGPFGAGLALGYTRAAYNTLVCSELEKPGFEPLMDCDGARGGWRQSRQPGKPSPRRGCLRRDVRRLGNGRDGTTRRLARIGYDRGHRVARHTLGGADSALALVGRALTGAAAGMSSAVTPALVAETATKASRGQLVAFGQLAFSFGVLTQIAVALIGTWVDYARARGWLGLCTAWRTQPWWGWRPRARGGSRQGITRLGCTDPSRRCVRCRRRPPRSRRRPRR